MGLLYTSIRVKDMPESVKFYTKKLGLKVIGRRTPIPGEKIVMLLDKQTKQRLNLMWYGKNCRLYTPWKEDGVEMDHLLFEVKDAKKDFKKLVKGGAPIAMDLMERVNKADEFYMGFVKDPNGIWVGILTQKGKKLIK